MKTIKIRREIKIEAYTIYDLSESDIGKEITLVFYDRLYTGFLKRFTDEQIILSRPNCLDLGFPLGGIIAWFYGKIDNARRAQESE